MDSYTRERYSLENARMRANNAYKNLLYRAALAYEVGKLKEAVEGDLDRIGDRMSSLESHFIEADLIYKKALKEFQTKKSIFDEKIRSKSRQINFLNLPGDLRILDKEVQSLSSKLDHLRLQVNQYKKEYDQTKQEYNQLDVLMSSYDEIRQPSKSESKWLIDWLESLAV